MFLPTQCPYREAWPGTQGVPSGLRPVLPVSCPSGQPAASRQRLLTTTHRMEETLTVTLSCFKSAPGAAFLSTQQATW